MNPRVMPSKFSGECSACGVKYVEGDMIQWVSGFKATHAACAAPSVPSKRYYGGWRRGSRYRAAYAHEDDKPAPTAAEVRAVKLSRYLVMDPAFLKSERVKAVESYRFYEASHPGTMDYFAEPYGCGEGMKKAKEEFNLIELALFHRMFCQAFCGVDNARIVEVAIGETGA